MPDVLQQHGWDCPEAAELNLWALEFLRHQSVFSEKERSVGKPYADLFRSVADIRHTVDAESLAKLLQNEECLSLLTKLRQTTQSAIEELERNKHVLRSKLEDTLERLAAQRAELDRLQNAAVTEMVKEDDNYRAFAGTSLEQAIESLEFDPAAILRQGTSSELNDTDSVEECAEPSLARCQDN